jgi:oligopeptide/dipeptide ABC transporter ATP-binding protein
LTHEPPILCVEDLHLSYSADGRVVDALRGASISVYASESVGLVGESGSGKSSLARAAMGLIPAHAAVTSGRILIEQRDVTHLRQADWDQLRGHPLAIVFQDPMSYLNPVMRIDRQIAEGIRLHDAGIDVGRRTQELLELVNLRPGVARAFPHELSGGMRQRVLLAIALSCKPRVLIADEPTTALDVTTQADILRLLSEIQRELGMGLLLISHDLGVVSSTCQRLYVMYAGRTIESGPTREVCAAPGHPYTYGLMQAATILRATDGRFATIEGDPPDLSTNQQGCPFAARCPYVLGLCVAKTPPELQIDSEGEHRARCWLLAPSGSKEC